MSEHNLIKIDEARYQQGVQFAEQVAITNAAEYARRGQDVADKLKLDNRTCKLAEWAVYDYITARERKGRVVSPPDFKIYPAWGKTFDADLTVGDIKVHVKSQTYESAKQFSESWMFQKKDTLTHAPEDNEFVAFCLVNETTREVELRLFVKASELVGLYGEAKSPALRATKTVIYYGQVEHLTKRLVKQ